MLWFHCCRSTGGKKPPKASMEARRGLCCWAHLKFILLKTLVIHWGHSGQTLNYLPPPLCERDSMLLAGDVDMYKSVSGAGSTGKWWQISCFPCGKSGNSCFAEWIQIVCSWLCLACPSKIAHLVQASQSLWSVKGTMWITQDSRLRTCFRELFWFEANDKYFVCYDCLLIVINLTQF